MKRVLGFGNALVDLLIQMKDDSLIKQLNLPKGSMTMVDESQADHISEIIKDMDVPKVSGGSAANTIHGIAKLGQPCGYIGKINNDDLGDFFKQDLANAGIDANLLIGESKTGRASTFISTDSERTFATFLGAAVEMNDAELNSSMFKGYDVFHIEGYLIYNTVLTEQALKLAKEQNMLISIDLASYNVVEDNLAFLQRIIPEYVDIVFANEEESKAYTSKEPAEALEVISEQCAIAIVKIGKDGSMIKTNGEVTKIGVIKCSPIDTTGAGDAYAAGFIYGYLNDLSMEQSGKIAALVSGKVIEKYGARIPDADWPAILNTVKTIQEN